MTTKLVILDLDGVLISTRDLHFDVLNQALGEEDQRFVISQQEHLLKFDGLSTMKKLDILEKERGLSPLRKELIWKRKQELTLPELVRTVSRDEKIIKIITKLKADGMKVWVASNSIQKSVNLCVSQLGIYDLLNGYVGNENVESPKPHPEIYWRIMIGEKVLPSETLIVEDSYVGRTSATASGATVCPVKNKDEVTMDRIYSYINKDKKVMKWQDDKMNVLIPMAGFGSRFETAGYTFPKPLIEVNGKPMIQLVVENLNIEANLIYIVRQEHYDKYNLQSLLTMLTPGCKIITVDKVTEGAACTTLLAKYLIDNDNPLLIANSDQFMEWQSGEFYHSLNSNIDGSIVCFQNFHPKFSYVKTDEFGNALQVAEKVVISNHATTGVYYFAKGSDYVKYARQMIDANDRFNNEFYVSKVYNYAVADGKLIKTFAVEKMHCLGDPDSLKAYLEKHGSR